jgi:hypothetical protein
MSEHRRRRRIDDDDEDDEDDEDYDEEESDDEEDEEEEEEEGGDEVIHHEEQKTKNVDEINLTNLDIKQNDGDHHLEEERNKFEQEEHEKKIKKKNRSENKKSRGQEKSDDPFVVPRGTRFFLHDDRKVSRSQAKVQQPKNRKSDEMNWKHDKFDELIEEDSNSNHNANHHRSQRNYSEDNSVDSQAFPSHRTERGGRRGRGRVVTSVRGRGRGRVLPEYQNQSSQILEQKSSSPLEATHQTEPLYRHPESESQRLADLYRREGGRTRRGRGRGPSSYDSHLNSSRGDPPLSTSTSESLYISRRGGRSEIPGRGAQIQKSEHPYTESEILNDHPTWSWGSENGRNNDYREKRGGGRTRGRGRSLRSEHTSSESYEMPSHPDAYPEGAPSNDSHIDSDVPPFQSSAASTPADSVPAPTSFPPPQQPQVKHSLKLKATAHEFHPSPGPDFHSPSADEYHHTSYGSSMDRVPSISPDYHTSIPVPMYPPHNSPNPDAIPPPLYYPPSYHPHHPAYYYPPPQPYHHHPSHLPYHLPPDMANHHHSYSPHPYDPSQYLGYDSSQTDIMEESPSHQYYQSPPPPSHNLHHHPPPPQGYYPTQH